MFFGLFSKNRKQSSSVSNIAEDLYSCAMFNTRKKCFYEHAGVPDTFDGRFDLLLVHIFIIFHILATGGGRKGRVVFQALFDRMFDDMNATLREMGAGDVGVSRQIKRMMNAFNGRLKGYQDALCLEKDTGDLLKQALMRNLYGSVHDEIVDESNLAIMEKFVRENIKDKKGGRREKILKGDIVFDNYALNREKEQSGFTNKQINK